MQCMRPNTGDVVGWCATTVDCGVNSGGDCRHRVSCSEWCLNGLWCINGAVALFVSSPN